MSRQHWRSLEGWPAPGSAREIQESQPAIATGRAPENQIVRNLSATLRPRHTAESFGDLLLSLLIVTRCFRRSAFCLGEFLHVKVEGENQAGVFFFFFYINRICLKNGECFFFLPVFSRRQ